MKRRETDKDDEEEEEEEEAAFRTEMLEGGGRVDIVDNDTAIAAPVEGDTQ